MTPTSMVAPRNHALRGGEERPNESQAFSIP